MAVPALAGDAHEVVKAPVPRQRVLDWASLLARIFGDALLECRCGGRRRIAAYVRESAKAEELLEQLGIPVHEPRLVRAGEPPQQELFDPSPVDAADPITRTTEPQASCAANGGPRVARRIGAGVASAGLRGRFEERRSTAAGASAEQSRAPLPGRSAGRQFKRPSPVASASPTGCERAEGLLRVEADLSLKSIASG